MLQTQAIKHGKVIGAPGRSPHDSTWPWPWRSRNLEKRLDGLSCEKLGENGGELLDTID